MQSKKTLLILTLTIMLGTSLNGVAQGPGGRGGQGHRPPTPAIDTALDADGDHVLSAEEIAEAASFLAELDKDNDRGLSFSEYMGFSSGENSQQGPPAGRSGSSEKPPMPPTVSALDTSGDGVIDANEIADAQSALLELDKNGDGALQAEEYLPPRTEGRMGGRPSNNR